MPIRTKLRMLRNRFLQRSGQPQVEPPQKNLPPSTEAGEAGEAGAGRFHREVEWSERSEPVLQRSVENGPDERNGEEPVPHSVEASQVVPPHHIVQVANAEAGEPDCGSPADEAQGDIFSTLTGKELNINQIRNFLRDREIIEKELETSDRGLLTQDEQGALSSLPESMEPFDSKSDFLNRFIRHTILIESNGKGGGGSSSEGPSGKGR